jgi:hypothetical protein
MTVFYTKTYATLAGTNTNDWLTYAEDLIESRARWWLHNRITKNMEDAAAAKDEELDALQALREKTQDSASTEPLQPTTF